MGKNRRKKKFIDNEKNNNYQYIVQCNMSPFPLTFPVQECRAIQKKPLILENTTPQFYKTILTPN